MPYLSIYTNIFNSTPSSQAESAKIWKWERRTLNTGQSSGLGIGQRANSVCVVVKGEAVMLHGASDLEGLLHIKTSL
jgi:hypothetical protein